MLAFRWFAFDFVLAGIVDRFVVWVICFWCLVLFGLGIWLIVLGMSFIDLYDFKFCGVIWLLLGVWCLFD